MPLSRREQNLSGAPRAATRPAGVTSAGVAAPRSTSPPKPETAPEKSPAPAVASAREKPPERGPATPPASQDSPVPPEVFAKLRLQVLVYSEVPSRRLVFINNQKYVEGQRIDADLVIERITSDGAVLSCQGKRLVLRSDQPPSR